MSFLLVLAAFLAALLAVHLVAAIVATRVIAARVEEENPPGGLLVPVEGSRLHLYDLNPEGEAAGPAILLLHGATSNARDMLTALGPELAQRHRVIVPDRPGHGWSGRPGGRRDASPARQAALVADALDAIGAGPVVVVGHSLAGAVACAFALGHPTRTAGLVLLAGVTHPWPGGIAWTYALAAMPVVGALFVNTVMAPIGAWGLKAAAAGSFAPLDGPAGYAKESAAALVLRPWEFRWNAQDVAALKTAVATQAPRYGEIRVPTAIVASEDDSVVSTAIHARAIARQVEGARLTVLQGYGHQVHHVAKGVVLAEIKRIAEEAGRRR
jgi:pimeloyl-ACP methyl ester carboxylesterase